MKQIALIKTGGTIAQIVPRHGDFENWFAKGLGVNNLLQVDVFRQQPLPGFEGLSGIVVTGSAAMVSERADWSERTAEWLTRAVDTGLPVLGVCYGHQLLAHALGGRVGRNPAGRQIGTVIAQRLASSANDPLLGHLPTAFAAQTSHLEVVLELPPGAERLAQSPLDDNFAIRFSESTWGVQFHAEFSRPVMAEYIHYRSDVLRQEGLSPEQLTQNTADSGDAGTVLAVFSRLAEARSSSFNENRQLVQ